MKIINISGKQINDSRNEKTILITIKTNIGDFSASSPSGKSVGKYEVKTYKNGLEEDINTLEKFSDYFCEENLEKFDDLRRVEDILDRHVGANTFFALESAILKAIAKEQKKQVWELIKPESINIGKIPRLVGNCIGGGKHSKIKDKPNFQEFLLIPQLNSARESFLEIKTIKKNTEKLLKENDKKFKSEKNDENAWMSSLNEKEVLELLKIIKEKNKIDIGIDVAASSFYKRKKYNYSNPLFKRDEEEQFSYISNLIKNFGIFYIEDPFNEEDFESFSKLLKKFPESLIVGDDLTVTNPKIFEKAIKMKSIRGIIVKPNQIGSLIDVKKVCEIAKKNNIKIIFSHRSGETEEDILADLAFGFQADFLKCGIDGKEREAKIKRLIQIEDSLKK